MVQDQKFFKKMEEKLIAEKKRVDDDLADFTIKTDKVRKTIFPTYGDKSGENAAEVASFDNAVSVKNILESTSRDVKAALKRIKEKTYGVCKYCGKNITKQRLEIRPTSSACIDCKNKLSNR